MIQVENVTKKYGQRLAVDRLNFTVNRGEILGFLGPNGAGKSTTMNIITGYLSATEGSVKLDGHDILEEPQAVKKQIGYMPELPPVYMDMTVRDYLSFVCDIKGVPRSRRKDSMEKSMEMLMISDVRGRLIKNLSKGYKQRVGIAQALIGTPPVLILDEPTIGLDPQQIIETRNLIRDLGKEHTIILSSHILPEVQAVCSRVLIINRGKIVASDTPENLSRGMTADNRLGIRVAGPEAESLAVARRIPQVVKAESIGSREQGTVDLVVEASKDQDVRREVFMAFAKADLPLLQMKSMDLTLEEIFLNLITETKGRNADMLAVFRRELRAYFVSPIGFVFVGFFMLIAGVFFAISNLLSANPAFNGVLSSLTFIFLFLVPILTMRLLSEETRQKTDQLLITSPLSITGIVLGKYLAAVGVFVITLLITVLFPVIMSFFALLGLGWREILGGYIGFLLMGCAFISIGLFFSSLTDNQLIAAMMTFAALLLIWILDFVAQAVPTDPLLGLVFLAIAGAGLVALVYFSTRNNAVTVVTFVLAAAVIVLLFIFSRSFFTGLIAKILGWFSLLKRYGDFGLGVLSLSPIVYYISFSGAFVFLTIRMIEKRRWA